LDQPPNSFLSAPCTIKEKQKGVEPQISTSRRFDKCLEKMRSRTSSLVANAYQIVGELLDSVGGNTRLDVLGVVGDEESLLGLDDDQTFLALVACQFTDV
jgi:hypothetical protein